MTNSLLFSGIIKKFLFQISTKKRKKKTKNPSNDGQTNSLKIFILSFGESAVTLFDNIAHHARKNASGKKIIQHKKEKS